MKTIGSKKLNYSIVNEIGLCLFFILVVSSLSHSQTEIFKSNLFNIKKKEGTLYSSIVVNENEIYFTGNNNKLYCFDLKSKNILYCVDIMISTSEPLLFLDSLIFTGCFYNNEVFGSVLNKKTGLFTQRLNIPKLKTTPQFLNDSVFVSTYVGKDGGMVCAYDLRKNAIIWNHFVGHGYRIPPYLSDSSIFANFDDFEWKEVTLDGKLPEDIYQKHEEEEWLKYESDENYKMFEMTEKERRYFYILSHDQKEIPQELIYTYYGRAEFLDFKINSRNTFFFGDNSLLVLKDRLKIQSNFSFEHLELPDNIQENEYRALLKVEDENVWFIYDNLLVNYNFIKHKVVKTFDFTKWNVHQMLLEEDEIWLISKNDFELYCFKV